MYLVCCFTANFFHDEGKHSPRWEYLLFGKSGALYGTCPSCSDSSQNLGFVSAFPHGKQLCRVLFAPISLTALFLRMKFKWNHSMLVSEEECDLAARKVCCVSERSLGAVRMRMG